MAKAIEIRNLRAAALVACLLVTVPAPAEAKPKQTRYSLAGGCYSLAPGTQGAKPPAGRKLRLRPTQLGRYLLFTRDEAYLTADGASVAPAAEPSPEADWIVREAGRNRFRLSPASATGSVLAITGGELALVPAADAGRAGKLRLRRARGCAVFPEAQLNVSGKPRRGKTSYGEVRGIFDGHMHWMNFEYLGGNFHCGRPWHRYGITEALPDCEEIEGPQGAAAPLQNFFNFGNPVAPHDTRGYPQLTEWRRDNVTYEGTYYRWLERAYRAGLKLIVMPTNDNRVLCELLPTKRNPCDEMAVTIQELENMYELQDYVDAQAGGPGKGWFEIARNPFQARRIINRGKMAVVLEVETSEIFNCRGTLTATCNPESITAGLEQLRKLGVGSSLLLNKFDTPLAGVRFDGGPVGQVINAGNRSSYGEFWDAETCTGPEADNTIEGGLPTPFITDLISQIGIGGVAPIYPPAPHCNKVGLSDLGEHMVREMMRLGMVVNPDHMGQAAVSETISIAEESGYSGVISPHGWIDPRNWPRIYQLGGMAFPSSGSPESFVDAYETYRPKSTPHYFGWAYGADLGGLASQPPGTPPGDPASVTYPFRSFDGATRVRRNVTGERTFDFPTEGVAHYGLYAEWAEEVRKRGGKPITSAMLRGPEAYLQMWERAFGIKGGRCNPARGRVGRRGLGKLRLGLGSKRLLARAGQPLKRTRAWTYCVAGKRGRGAGQAAVLTKRGRVALVGTTVRGQRALGVGTGDKAGKLERLDGAESLGGGLWAKRAGGRTYAWFVRGGKVRKAALASRRGARTERVLRANLRLVPKATKQRPSQLQTRPSNRKGPTEFTPLSEQQGATQFPAFCRL